MKLTRRDFLKASSAVAGAISLGASGLWRLEKAMAVEGTGLPVIWLQGSGCTGCSVSLLNTLTFGTIDTLLTQVLDVDFHPNLMAAAGDAAVAAAEADLAKGGIVLVIEGGIPTGAAGKYCTLWPGKTMEAAVQEFAAKSALILAVGNCACYGGMSAGSPNPTTVVGVNKVITDKTVVNLPGCPTHPDWVVGAVAYVLKYGQLPAIDALGRPTDFYGQTVHSRCPRLGTTQITQLGQDGCMMAIGCHGPFTSADCPIRRWNNGTAGQLGVNWCVGARTPCIGCTEPGFQDKGPYFPAGQGAPNARGGGSNGGSNDNSNYNNNGGGSDD